MHVEVLPYGAANHAMKRSALTEPRQLAIAWCDSTRPSRLLHAARTCAGSAVLRRNTLMSEGGRMADNALVTCLWFDTDGEAAATFYTSIFKDAKLGRVTRYTEAGPRPAGTVMEV